MPHYQTGAPAIPNALPKGPVLGWSSFTRVDAPGIPCVESLPNTIFTTSGRAAIFQAMLQLDLPAGSTVLVPTYHCPTMVAPVLLAGHRPVYFAIQADGLPHLDSIAPDAAAQAKAMLVSHYFGLAQSLRDVRAWCDARGIALIEDCAHSYFGQAGERPIGAWGDYCTASLSKFFPVPECGLLGSALHTLRPLQLQPQSLMAEIKGCVDVLEISARFQRLPGLNRLLSMVFSLKKGLAKAPPPAATPPSDPTESMMDVSDMQRIRRRPLRASLLLRWILPRGRVIARRQRNFRIYQERFAGLPGVRRIAMVPDHPVAPYVFPLWVDNAEMIYHTMRLEGMPVFRWDRLWPNMPSIAGDTGSLWSRHLIQFLCHQDLSEQDVHKVATRLVELLQSAQVAEPASTNKPSHRP